MITLVKLTILLNLFIGAFNLGMGIGGDCLGLTIGVSNYLCAYLLVTRTLPAIQQ